VNFITSWFTVSARYRQRSAARACITLAAVADWLNGADLNTLYDRYGFIDANKRRLVEIRDQAVAVEPELQNSAESGLEQLAGDIYRLFFRSSDRSCKVSMVGGRK